MALHLSLLGCDIAFYKALQFCYFLGHRDVGKSFLRIFHCENPKYYACIFMFTNVISGCLSVSLSVCLLNVKESFFLLYIYWNYVSKFHDNSLYSLTLICITICCEKGEKGRYSIETQAPTSRYVDRYTFIRHRNYEDS
jgi:hypothetical protein